MERITCLETTFEEVSRLRASSRGVHCCPLRGETGASLEAPVRIGFGDPLAHALAADVLKQPSAYDFADLGFVIGDEVACDASHDLGDALLPFLVPLSHLYLTAG